MLLQAQDAILGLKMNQFQLIYANMFRVFFALTSLELPQGSEYTKNMLMTLTILIWNKQNNTAMWKMFKEDPGAWNEEVGETGLGVLTRMTLGTGNASNRERCDKAWSLIHVNSKVCQGMMDSSCDWENDDKPRAIDKHGATVQAAQTWLRRVVVLLQHNQFQVYNKDEMAFEKDAVEHQRPPNKTKVFFEFDLEAAVRKKIPAFESQQVQFWVDSECKSDRGNNTLADRQRAWPIPDGAPAVPLPEEDNLDQGDASDNSWQEILSGNEPDDKQADCSDDSTDEEPLSRRKQRSQLSSVTSGVERPQETEAAKEARVLTAQLKQRQRGKRKVQSSGKEGRTELWDYVPVEDDAACSLIVHGKRPTAARTRNFAEEESP